MSTVFPTPHDRILRDGDCLRRPSRPRHPFSDNKVASRGSQMTRRAFGMPCSWPSDGVTTPPAGQPPGPGPSGGHEKHPGLAATRLTFVFQRCSGRSCNSHTASRLTQPAKRAERGSALIWCHWLSASTLGLSIPFSISCRCCSMRLHHSSGATWARTRLIEPASEGGPCSQSFKSAGLKLAKQCSGNSLRRRDVSDEWSTSRHRCKVRS